MSVINYCCFFFWLKFVYLYVLKNSHKRNLKQCGICLNTTNNINKMTKIQRRSNMIWNLFLNSWIQFQKNTFTVSSSNFISKQIFSIKYCGIFAGKPNFTRGDDDDRIAVFGEVGERPFSIWILQMKIFNGSKQTIQLIYISVLRWYFMSLYKKPFILNLLKKIKWHRNEHKHKWNEKNEYVYWRPT